MKNTSQTLALGLVLVTYLISGPAYPIHLLAWVFKGGFSEAVSKAQYWAAIIIRRMMLLRAACKWCNWGTTGVKKCDGPAPLRVCRTQMWWSNKKEIKVNVAYKIFQQSLLATIEVNFAPIFSADCILIPTLWIQSIKNWKTKREIKSDHKPWYKRHP